MAADSRNVHQTGDDQQWERFSFMKFYCFLDRFAENSSLWRNSEYEMNIARETSSTHGTRKYLVPVNYKLVISCTYHNLVGYIQFNFNLSRERKSDFHLGYNSRYGTKTILNNLY